MSMQETCTTWTTWNITTYLVSKSEVFYLKSLFKLIGVLFLPCVSLFFGLLCTLICYTSWPLFRFLSFCAIFWSGWGSYLFPFYILPSSWVLRSFFCTSSHSGSWNSSSVHNISVGQIFFQEVEKWKLYQHFLIGK